MARMESGPMDDPAWRWTVDGVSPNAQAAAREAAEREKLPLGAWVEAAIIQAVDREQDPSETRKPPAEDPRPSRRYF